MRRCLGASRRSHIRNDLLIKPIDRSIEIRRIRGGSIVFEELLSLLRALRDVVRALPSLDGKIADQSPLRRALVREAGQ